MNSKSIILGTAMWGWSIERPECFKLLDYYYNNGFREIDTASNYPINKNDNYFRYAENTIQEWIKVNGVNDIKIIIKVGSLSNDGSPYNNLKKSFLLLSYDYYLEKFGDNLNNFMIHWDSRNSEPYIKESLEALKIISEKGTDVGLSGIKYPDIYVKIIDELKLNPTIELKHNVVYSALKHYKTFIGKGRFLAYGINMGGINLTGDYKDNCSIKLRKIDPNLVDNFKEKLNNLIDSSKNTLNGKIKNINHLGLVYAYNNIDISGVIIGPSKIEQLKDSLDFWVELEQNNTDNLCFSIKKIADELI